MPGIPARLIARLQNFDELLELTATFARIYGIYVGALMLTLALAIRQTNIRPIIPAAIFIFGYWSALFAIYLITPHSLSWLLITSAERTWMVPNLCVVAIGLYVIGRDKNLELQTI